jgi:UDP-N-acetylglucosamine--N-acetylmuramyl-(pentapeptide) pyrophosphoryl-undecaprenol N-acetylglucosamine transferase
MALVEKDAAILITDKEAKDKLVDEALKLLFDEQLSAKLTNNIKKLARPNATEDIVNEIDRLIKPTVQ